MKRIGKVTLVGAGPGDPELITVKALRALERAEIVVYDRLVAAEILELAAPDAELVDVGKQAGNHPVPQKEINARLVAYAMSGRDVVRLKGGDPFIFGRGCEELAALEKAGIPVEIVPGITAAQGAAAAARMPLTHRGVARSVRYVTGHCRADEPLDLDWAGLADPETTLVVYMGRASIPEISEKLIAHGLPGDTPAYAVSDATTPSECRLVSTLATLAADVDRAGMPSPLLFVIGAVASFAEAKIARQNTAELLQFEEAGHA